jgi:hypothetical protein
MSGISIGALAFFLMAGLFLTMALIMFVSSLLLVIHDCKENAGKFVLLKSLMLIHTDEQITCSSQTMGMRVE